MGFRLFPVLLAALVFGCGMLYAQSEDLEAYLERGRALSKAGKFEQALPYFLMALELGERRNGTDSPAIVPMLDSLADLYAAQTQYRDAEPLYERSLEIQERALARYQAGIARTLNNLGSIYEATGRTPEARELYERVLTAWQPALGPDHPSVQAARERLARIAARAPPKPPEVAAPPPPPAPEFRIHLTSIRNPADAQMEWARLKRLYGRLLEGLELTVTRADLGAPRGVWYRIKAGPLSESGARSRCAAFAGRGVWCRVVRPSPPPAAAPAVAAKPAEEAAPAEPAPLGGFRIHLTSIRNPRDAEAEWARLKRLYGGLLRGLRLAVVRADLGPERGVYYRIQGGPLSRSAARALCAAFAARNVWCRVAPPLADAAEGMQRVVTQRVRRRAPSEARGTRRPRTARRRRRRKDRLRPRLEEAERGCRRYAAAASARVANRKVTWPIDGRRASCSATKASSRPAASSARTRASAWDSSPSSTSAQMESPSRQALRSGPRPSKYASP